MEQVETLSHLAFAETFLERVIEFLRERPAICAYWTRRSGFLGIRLGAGLCVFAIANALRAKDPSLTSEKAMLAANITLQMVKRMTTLYAEAGPKEKSLNHRRI
jgi:hypothetical protein